MKDGKLTRQGIEELRQNYPPGTRIELIHMDDKWAVAKGTRGTVTQVDDAGTIHMKWDNGRTLGLAPQPVHPAVPSFHDTGGRRRILSQPHLLPVPPAQ